MKTRAWMMIAVIALMLVPSVCLGEGEQKFADLDGFKTESGQVIKGLKIGYRTFGALNAEKSNALLMPTWFMGTTQEMIDLGQIGAGRLADSSKYFVVAVDSIGNGVSTSPSNSRTQPGRGFPKFSIRDMVNAAHGLLANHLGLKRVHAVVGISMGGFQALEFAVARPDFAARIVSIEGTPRPALPDILLWETELRAVESLKDLKKGDKTAMKIISPVHTAALWTPPYLSGPSVPASAETFIGRADEGINKYDAWNWARQLEAIRNQDIYRFFDGNMKLAAGTVKARVLMILSPHDHMVNPLPSHEFARLAAAEVVELQGECGHMAFVCESAKVAEAAANFLEKQ